ncbi:MAG: hypothetical protein IT405_03220 [Candidatus Yanofskybacteria bacterium]|nr:hypothetical protein [Candidatus Yanofskybacteria bacterium]
MKCSICKEEFGELINSFPHLAGRHPEVLRARLLAADARMAPVFSSADPVSGSVSDGPRIAPEGQVWVCMACGKMSRDRYSAQGPGDSPGWDESCMLNSVLLKKEKLVIQDGRVREVR